MIRQYLKLRHALIMTVSTAMIALASACSSEEIDALNDSLLAAQNFLNEYASSQSLSTLSGVTWRLVSDNPDVAASIVFDANNNFGLSACNQFSGRGQFDGNILKLSSFSSTLVGCPEPIDRWSKQFLSVAASTTGYAVVRTGKQLLLKDPITLQTLYTFVSEFLPAANSETRFIELAAYKVPCATDNSKQCYKYRQLELRSDGVEIPNNAPWQEYPYEIYGYTHTQGQSAKLRIRIDNQSVPPAGYPSPIWYNELVYALGQPTVDLTGVTWQLESNNPSISASLSFDSQGFRLRACNTIVGSTTIEGVSLKLSPGVSTMIGCSQDYENWTKQFFNQPNGFTVVRNGTQLLLKDPITQQTLYTFMAR